MPATCRCPRTPAKARDADRDGHRRIAGRRLSPHRARRRSLVTYPILRAVVSPAADADHPAHRRARRSLRRVRGRPLLARLPVRAHHGRMPRRDAGAGGHSHADAASARAGRALRRELHRDAHFAAGARPAIDGPVYVSVDLDGLDPAFAPGVSHREPGGLSVRDVMSMIHQLRGPIVGADVVEFNPSAGSRRRDGGRRREDRARDRRTDDASGSDSREIECRPCAIRRELAASPSRPWSRSPRPPRPCRARSSSVTASPTCRRRRSSATRLTPPLKAGHTFYTHTAGYAELREAIARKIHELHGVALSAVRDHEHGRRVDGHLRRHSRLRRPRRQRRDRLARLRHLLERRDHGRRRTAPGAAGARGRRASGSTSIALRARHRSPTRGCSSSTARRIRPAG